MISRSSSPGTHSSAYWRIDLELHEGQDPMMDAIETALGEVHVPMTKYHSERYSFV